MIAWSILAAAAFVLVYTLFLYPLLLHLLAKRRERPIRRAPITPSVSILLAARNGGPWLAAKLDSLLALGPVREARMMAF